MFLFQFCILGKHPPPSLTLTLKPLTYPIGTIPPSSGTATAASHSVLSSQPSPAAVVGSTVPHSASSQHMMVMLPLNGSNGGASALSGGHLISTDEVINMLQQQHILQVVKSPISIFCSFRISFCCIMNAYVPFCRNHLWI